MRMTRNERKVFSALKRDFITYKEAQYIYDIDFLPLQGNLIAFYKDYLAKYKPMSRYMHGEHLWRVFIEEYLRRYKLYSFEDASIQWATTPESLRYLLSYLGYEKGRPVYYPSHIPDDLFPGEYIRLHRFIPRCWETSEEPIEYALHRLLEKELPAGKFEKILCSEPNCSSLASQRCFITKKPLCHNHGERFHFIEKHTLCADICATSFVADHFRTLKKYFAYGNSLDRYKQNIKKR